MNALLCIYLLTGRC